MDFKFLILYFRPKFQDVEHHCTSYNSFFICSSSYRTIQVIKSSMFYKIVNEKFSNLIMNHSCAYFLQSGCTGWQNIVHIWTIGTGYSNRITSSWRGWGWNKESSGQYGSHFRSSWNFLQKRWFTNLTLKLKWNWNAYNIFIIFIILVVVKTTVLLADIGDFGKVNEIYRQCKSWRCTKNQTIVLPFFAFV